MPWMKPSINNRPVVGDRVQVGWFNGPREGSIVDCPLAKDKKKLYLVRLTNGGMLDVTLKQLTGVWREDG